MEDRPCAAYIAIFVAMPRHGRFSIRVGRCSIAVNSDQKFLACNSNKILKTPQDYSHVKTRVNYPVQEIQFISVWIDLFFINTTIHVILMTSKTIKTVLFASLAVALLASLAGMGLIHTAKTTDSLSIPNTERDIKLAAGYELYPGVGWVSPEDQFGQIEPIYKENPSTGKNVLDLDAMIKRDQKR